MLTEFKIKHEEAFKLIWPDAIRYAKSVLADGYLTSGGTPRQKTNKQRTIDYAELQVLVEVIWRLSGDVYTPHYWHMKIIKEASITEKDS